jgi:hypothetical protein
VQCRKPGPLLSEFLPWASARFHSQETRDQFLRVTAMLPANNVEAEPMPNERLSALVRWRPGHFLGLNDIAYSLGGRIAGMQRRGRLGSFGG